MEKRKPLGGDWNTHYATAYPLLLAELRKALGIVEAAADGHELKRLYCMDVAEEVRGLIKHLGE